MAADELEFDGAVFDAEAMESLRHAYALWQQAVGAESPKELARRIESLIETRQHDEAVTLLEGVDEALLDRAVAEARRALDRVRCLVAGVEIPAEVERSLREVPSRSRTTMIAGIVAGIRALAEKHPKLGRILDNATARREEGKVFAEASREVRDRNYRERVQWVATKYREVRGKYGEGVAGDRAARLEVAVIYSRLTGKKRMHDRSVCNILADASAVLADHPVDIAE
jgi:hypothetical protein